MDPRIQATLDTLNSPRNLANGGARWGFDEARGLYYSVDQRTGKKSYQANTGMPGATDTTPTDTTGIFHKRPQFNQRTGTWDTPFDWSNAMSLGLGGAIGANAIGAIAGAGSGAGVGGSVAGDVAGVDTAIGSMGAGGWAAPAGTAAIGGLQAVKDKLVSPSGAASLLGLITTLANRPNGNGSGGDDVLGQFPQIQELLSMGTERAKRTDPLHQAVTQLAMSRLPMNVQKG